MKDNEYSRERRRPDKRKNGVKLAEAIKILGTETEMKYCPNCRRVVFLNDGECINCGTDFPVILSFGAKPEGKA
jgi:hypothetical protein